MTDTLENYVVEFLPIELVRPAPDNPRTDLGDLVDMAASIRSIGIIQPIIAVPTGELADNGEDEMVMVVAGHRRLGAAELAEQTHVRIIVRTDIDEAQRLEMMFSENWHREDLNPIENARAVQLLADAGKTQREIAERAGISQPTVSKWISLLKLPEKAQDWVTAGTMTQEDAVTLASLPEETVKELIKKAAPPSEWEIRQEKVRLDNERAYAKAVKEAADKGWAVLDKAPDWDPPINIEAETDPAALDDDRDDPFGFLAHIDPVQHEHESCHAVYIGRQGLQMAGCTNPTAHPRPEGWKSPADIEREAEEAEIAAEAHESIEQARPPAVKQGSSFGEYEARKARVELLVAPIRELTRFVIAEVGEPDGFVLDYILSAVLAAEEPLSDVDNAAELLGLERDPADDRWEWAKKAIEKEVANPEGSTSQQVLYAMAIGPALHELTGLLMSIDQTQEVPGLDEEEWERCLGFFDHLTRMVEDVPPLGDLAMALIAPPEIEDEPEPGARATIEIFKKSGTFRQRCSVCGVLQGSNTKEDYAKELGDIHLRDVHADQLAEEGAA